MAIAFFTDFSCTAKNPETLLQVFEISQKIMKLECRKRDLNPHDIATTGT